MKLTVISDITFDPILKNIREHTDASIKNYVYSDQIVSELIKPKAFEDPGDVILIHFDSFFFRYSDVYISEILNAVKGLANEFTGNILLSNNMANGRHGSILKTNIGQQDQVIIELKEAIQGILQTSNVYFYDVKKLMSGIGLQNVYNFKLGFLYQMPYTKDFITALGSELISLIRFLSTPEKKAIFVDCDNTLWNGILGEDGLEGIQCDRNAKGVLYFQFQEFLLEKKKEGFILGLCSKNNGPDVQEAFEKMNMPLKWDDFLIKKVNWENKSENLKESAEEINIGLDSIIFIDDNDFELESVRSLCPEISTLKLSNDYNSFLVLCDNYWFKRKRLTKEDMEKSDQYFAEQLRNNMKGNVRSFEDYLESLEIKMDITINNRKDLARLSQLTEKTNQFNFNKEPLSIQALEEFIANNNIIYGLRVSDKFGDYGLVGLILMEIDEKGAKLRNFLLSCRALGRQIEDNFLNYVLNDLIKKEIDLEEILFKETTKNAPARIFYNAFKKSWAKTSTH